MKNKSRTLKLLVCIMLIMASGNVLAQKSSQQRKNRKPPTFKQLLKDMDANEDGKLSKKEVKGPLKKDFDKVDSNEDGFISEKEFANAPRPERKQGKNRN